MHQFPGFIEFIHLDHRQRDPFRMVRRNNTQSFRLKDRAGVVFLFLDLLQAVNHQYPLMQLAGIHVPGAVHQVLDQHLDRREPI